MAAVAPILLKSSAEYIIHQNKLSGASATVVAGSKFRGKVRRSAFSVILASQVAGTYGLCRIPAGAIINGIKFCNSATLGSTTISLGVVAADGSGSIDAAGTQDSDSLAKFRADAVSTVTTGQSCADSIALGFMYETEKELYLVLTVATATAPASGTLKGFIEYLEVY